LVDELSILIEDLDAVVTAIGDEQPSFGIESETMRTVELARSRSLLPPGLDEFPVLGELDDPRVGVAAMAVRDEDIAVRSDR